MTGVSKKEQALRDRYQAGAIKIIEEFGGVRRSPEYAEFNLMTDYGYLRVSVHDNWVATRFDRPKLARAGTDCNPYSGKWNHHCFGLGEKTAGNERVDAYLGMLRDAFERVGARKWEPVSVPITAEEVDASNIETLRDREACGEIFTVVGFDKHAAATEISSQATDGYGNREEWFVRSNYSHYMGMSDIEAYVSLRDWRRHLANEAQEAPASPAP